MDYVVGVSDSVSNNAKKLLNLNKIETVPTVLIQSASYEIMSAKI